ncbi:MAG: S8 family serine peptidase, partial [Bacteroidota bacterium]
PVVINYSIGNPHGPHDGLTEQEEFLRSTFGGNSERRLFVTSAGNDAGDEIYGIATIPESGSPDSGSVDITFELYDRRTVRTSYERGKISDNTSYLDIDMWYRDPGAAGSVTVALKLPGRSDFESDLLSGGGPQAGAIGNRNQFEYKFTHKSETAMRPATNADPATEVTRHNIHLKLPPHNGYFETGNYIVRLSGPPDTKIHIWCDISDYKGSKYGIKFVSADPPEALEKETEVDQVHLISIPSGASNILTVAALNDDSSISSYSQGEIVSFSSRGPLMDYSNLGPYTDKPDIAAPGYTIMAARSNFSAPPGKSPCCQRSACSGYTSKSGTSMASPHVAGIAALLLEKNNDLTTSQLIDLIKNNVATTDQPLDQNEYGSGIVDAKSAYDAVP